MTDIAVRSGRGEPWLISVEGEAGIGKTSLVREFTANLTGATVLWSQGDDAEKDLPLGILAQLLAKAPRAVLASCPSLVEGVRAGRPALEIGDHLLALIDRLQSTGPLVIVVDDWQWADEASTRVLVFVARRLWADAVLLVLVSRPDLLDEAHRRVLEGGIRSVQVPVGAMSAQNIVAMAQGLGLRLSGQQAAEVRRVTGGHALYARTLLASLTSDVLTESTDAWPRAVSLDAMIQDQWARLREDSRSLLEALAVLEAQGTLAQVGALAGISDTAAAVQKPLAMGLIERSSTGRVRFRHPILRDAVYAVMPADRRRSLHAAAATVVGWADSWAHRVAAAEGADPCLVAELVALADQEAGAGEIMSAAKRLLWAADLATAGRERETYTMRAAALLLVSRRPSRAMALRSAIEGCAPSALRSTLLGLFTFSEGDLRGAIRQLEEARTKAEGSSEFDAVILPILMGLTLAHALLGEGREAVEAAERAFECDKLNLFERQTASVCLASGRAFQNGPQDALRAYAERGWTAADARDAAPTDSHLVTTRAFFKVMSGFFHAAIEDTAAALRLARHSAVPVDTELAYFSRGIAQHQLGQWDETLISAEQAVTAAYTDGRVWSYSMIHALEGLVHAGRGEWEQAENSLAESRQWGVRINPDQSSMRTPTATLHGWPPPMCPGRLSTACSRPRAP